MVISLGFFATAELRPMQAILHTKLTSDRTGDNAIKFTRILEHVRPAHTGEMITGRKKNAFTDPDLLKEREDISPDKMSI